MKIDPETLGAIQNLDLNKFAKPLDPHGHSDLEGYFTRLRKQTSELNLGDDSRVSQFDGFGTSPLSRPPQKSQFEIDFDKFRTYKDLIPDSVKLFAGQDSPSPSSPQDNSFEHIHKAFLDIQRTESEEQAINALAALPKDCTAKCRTTLLRGAVHCVELIKGGSFDSAGCLADVFEFSDQEREFLLATALALNKTDKFAVITANSAKPLCVHDDYILASKGLGIPDANVEPIYSNAYRYNLTLAIRGKIAFDKNQRERFAPNVPAAELRKIEIAAIKQALLEPNPISDFGSNYFYKTGGIGKFGSDDPAKIAVELVKNSQLTVKDLQTNGLIQIATEVACSRLKSPSHLSTALSLIRAFDIPLCELPSELLEVVSSKSLSEALASKNIKGAAEIVDTLKISDLTLRDSPARSSAKEWVIAEVSCGRADSIQQLRNSPLIESDFWNSANYQSAAISGFRRWANNPHRISLRSSEVDGAVASFNLNVQALCGDECQAVFRGLLLGTPPYDDDRCHVTLLNKYVNEANRISFAAASVAFLLRNPWSHSHAAVVVEQFLNPVSPRSHLDDLPEPLNQIALVAGKDSFKRLMDLSKCMHLISNLEFDKAIELADLEKFSAEETAAILTPGLVSLFSLSGKIGTTCQNYDPGEAKRNAGLAEAQKAREFGKNFGLDPVICTKINIEVYQSALGTVSAHTFKALRAFAAELGSEERGAAEIAAIRSRLERIAASVEVAKKPHRLERTELVKLLDICQVKIGELKQGGLLAMIEECALSGLSHSPKNESPAVMFDPFELSSEFRESRHVQGAGRIALVNALNSRQLDFAAEIVQALRIDKTVTGCDEISSITQQMAIEYAREGRSDRIVNLASTFPIAQNFWESEQYQEAAKSGLCPLFYRQFPTVAHAMEEIAALRLSRATLAEEDTQGNIESGLVSQAGQKQFNILVPAISELVSDENKARIAAAVVGTLLRQEPIPTATATIINEFLGDVAPASVAEKLPSKIAQIALKLEQKSFDELYTLLSKNGAFRSYINQHQFEVLSIDHTHVAYATQLHITLNEADILVKAGVDLKPLADSGDFDGLAEALHAHVDLWNDNDLIWNSFQRGREIFGAEKMFIYLNYRNKVVEQGANRHDALIEFNKIIAVQRSLGITPDRFFFQILDQVRRDGGEYSEGNSYHLFNRIARQFPDDPEKLLEQAAKHRTHDTIGELVDALGMPGSPGNSWREIRQFSRLQRLVQSADLAPELEKLRDSNNNGLYNLVSTLVFDPQSHVDMDAVISLWQTPGVFFDQKDEHIPVKVRSWTNPGSFTKVPYLNLSAEDLRDAIANGVLDRLQRFRPFEMRIRLPKDLEVYSSTRIATRRAIGSRSKKIAGLARSPKEVFRQVNDLMPEGVSVQDYIFGNVAIDKELEARINNILFDAKIGLPIETQDIVMAVQPKSSARGIMAGNDTACCMPFGRGKANDYWTNLGTATMTGEIVSTDDKRRTFVQSVLRLDQSIGCEFPLLLEAVKSGNFRLDLTLPKTVLEQTGRSIITADNREPSKNCIDARYRSLGDVGYQVFIREYIGRYGELLGASTQNYLPIGKQYSSTSKHLDEIPNHQAPRAPVGYTDMSESTAFRLELGVDLPPFLVLKTNDFGLANSELDDHAPKSSQISELTIEDILAVSYLEGKIYGDIGLSISIANHTPMLMAIEIKNGIEQRAPLSFKFVDSNTNNLCGYLIAYEGVLPDTKEPFIYVEDLAAEGAHGTGKRLIDAFLTRYKRDYLDCGRSLPIHAELREGTSYEFIKRRIARSYKSHGISLELEELGPHTVGNETMHRVVIRPKL